MQNEDENFDSTNEETLEANESEDESRTDEEESREETEVEDSEDLSGDDEPLTLTKAELEEIRKEERKKQDKRWKERIKEAEKGGKKGSEKEEVASDSRLDRIELKAEGVKARDEQDFVLEYAQTKGIDISEALESRVVQAELRELREQKKSSAATQRPSQRTVAPQRNTVDYWARQMKEKGKLAPTAEMRSKVRKHLAGK